MEFNCRLNEVNNSEAARDGGRAQDGRTRLSMHMGWGKYEHAQQ